MVSNNIDHIHHRHMVEQVRQDPIYVMGERLALYMVKHNFDKARYVYRVMSHALAID